MLLLGCSQGILLLLSCSELLDSQRIGPLEQLERETHQHVTQNKEIYEISFDFQQTCCWEL